VHATRAQSSQLRDGSVRVTFELDGEEKEKYLKYFGIVNCELFVAFEEAQEVYGGVRRGYRELVDGTLQAQIDFPKTTGEELLVETPIGGIFQIFQVQRVPEEVPADDYGELARQLRLSAFFRTPKVLKEIGTDADYLRWVRLQPSAISGAFSEFRDGEGRCEAAHITLTEAPFGADKGFQHKPEYSALPLTHTEHMIQHQHGYEHLKPKDWWLKKRVEYVVKWAWDELKSQLGYVSWSELPPEVLVEWAKEGGVEKFVPRAYKENL